MNHWSLLLLVLILSGKGLFAQNHEHSEHQHEHPKNEVGVANHLVYLGGEKVFSYGLHIHYLRTFEESKFGAGLGYEQIFYDESHKSLGIIGSYRPFSQFYCQLSPGILFIGNDNPAIRFNVHIETTYEFEINHFHIGPALGFAYSFPEYHVSLGLHLAYGF